MASYRFVVSVFVLLALLIVAAQTINFYVIRHERERQLRHLCAEVDQVRMGIRDFLEQRTEVPDSQINRYFAKVDCDGL
jgi:hypothetical protein